MLALLSTIVRLRLHLSVLAVLLSTFISRVARTPLDTAYLIVLALMVTLLYGINALTDSTEDQINDPIGYSLIRKFQTQVTIFLLLTGIFFVIATITVILNKPVLAIPLIFSVPAGLLYSKKVFPKLRRLKEIKYLKTLVPSLVWALSTCWPTMVYLSAYDGALLSMLVFLSVIEIELLWDWRDRLGDLHAGVANPIAHAESPQQALIVSNLITTAALVGIPFMFERKLLISAAELATQLFILRCLLSLVSFLWISQKFSLIKGANLFIYLNIGTLLICHIYLL